MELRIQSLTQERQKLRIEGQTLRKKLKAEQKRKKRLLRTMRRLTKEDLAEIMVVCMKESSD